jgi:hypothetical protein
VIDLRCQGAGHLREAAVGDAAHHLHLAQAQMGMDDAQGNGQVAIAFGLDEGHQMVVPADRHGATDRAALGGQGGNPPLHADLLGQGREQGTASEQRRDQNGNETTLQWSAMAHRASLAAGPSRNMANHRIWPAVWLNSKDRTEAVAGLPTEIVQGRRSARDAGRWKGAFCPDGARRDDIS